MNRKSVTKMATAALAAVACTAAYGSQVVQLDLKGLTKSAEVIAVGRCTGCSADWNAQGSHIYTTVNLQVSQYLKGFLGATIQFKQLGGQVGDQVLQVQGMPKFDAGEQVILFMARDINGGYQVIGLQQGKFNVATNAATGDVEVKGFGMSKQVLSRSFPGNRNGTLLLADFLKQVKSYVGATQ